MALNSEGENPANFQEAVDPILDLIDQELGFDEVAVNQRPFKAACKLVQDFIPEVRIGDEPPKPPGKMTEFINEAWFKDIYNEVQTWYGNRYGERTSSSGPDSMVGVTLVASTPFEFRAPITASRIEVEGETSWLSFPSALLPDDNVRDWIVRPPNWDSFSLSTIKKSDKDLKEVATLLRRISSRLIGASLKDDKVRNILAGVKIHLRSAAILIANEGQEGSYARAQWELQMACESAYKGLLQQKTGSFPEIHDIFVLNDHANLPEKSVKHQWIKNLPRWGEAAELRYGLGEHPTIVGIFFWYKQTLKIIAGVFENLDGLNLSKAQLLLKKPPWIELPQKSLETKNDEDAKT